jgi:hypothetical protein
MNSKDNEQILEKDHIFLIKIFILIVVFVFLLPVILGQVKISKSRLQKYYGVDGKTFNKWYQYFCSDISDIDKLKKKRKIRLSTYWRIKSTLGSTSDFTVMRKVAIVSICNSDYRTLRNNIKIAPSSIGINIQTYDRLSIFPPKICSAIICWFG